jgi:hypothetical protein
MDLSLTADQIAILGALESLAKPYAAPPPDCRGFSLFSQKLETELTDGGFMDVAFDPELGRITAALVVEQLARLPYAAEIAASALIRPMLGEHLSRPVCLVEAANTARPVRFLVPGASVVVLHKDAITSFTATADDVVVPAESLYAYPMAMLADGTDQAERSRIYDISPQLLRTRWRVGLAAEIAGLLAASLDCTVRYVSERKQFGRPIGTFQAVRHRLAEAKVRTTGARWLALKAAYSDDAGDAALAAQYAQESASQIVYDLHQFLGAMGVTLEHPLHLWTYRIKALLSELGGFSVQAVAAADAIWAD